MGAIWTGRLPSIRRGRKLLVDERRLLDWLAHGGWGRPGNGQGQSEVLVDGCPVGDREDAASAVTPASAWACMTFAEVAPILDPAQTPLLEVLGASPRPAKFVSALARRRGVTWQVAHRTAVATGAIELRRLDKSPHWAPAAWSDGKSSLPHDGTPNLSIHMGDRAW
jgi:hypothetical protein